MSERYPKLFTTPNDPSSTPSKKSRAKVIAFIVSVAIIIGGIVAFLLLRGKPLKEIVFESSELSFLTGETKPVTIHIVPEDATRYSLEWKTSDESVAIVDQDGVVTGVGEGTAFISVIASSGKVYPCTIVVRPTAFDFCKKYAGTSTNGRTVGTFQLSDGSIIRISMAYDRTDDVLKLISASQSDGEYSSAAFIAVPSTLTGEYEGAQDRSFYVPRTSIYKPGKTVTTYSFYKIDAANFTESVNLKPYHIESTQNYAGAEDTNAAVFTATANAILKRIAQDVLAPNGYSLADLGFTSYNFTQ